MILPPPLPTFLKLNLHPLITMTALTKPMRFSENHEIGGPTPLSYYRSIFLKLLGIGFALVDL